MTHPDELRTITKSSPVSLGVAILLALALVFNTRQIAQLDEKFPTKELIELKFNTTIERLKAIESQMGDVNSLKMEVERLKIRIEALEST